MRAAFGRQRCADDTSLTRENIMKRILAFGLLLLVHGAAIAQTTNGVSTDLRYSYAEFRFVDYDENGGDGFRINGSYDLGNNWIIVGGVTSADFNNNVDLTTFEFGGGYVWRYRPDWDIVGTARFVNADVDTPGGSSDDSGLALSGGLRGWIAPNFEVRGSVNYINLDDSDTFLELAGDYYFTQRFSAGLSLEFAGDADLFSVGARYYFR
jgi:hypothetical protein